MRLRVLGILSVLCLILVFSVSSAILASTARELTQELQINRVASLNRLAQIAYDAAVDGDTTGLRREMDNYSNLYAEGILVRLQQGSVQSGDLSDDRADVRQALARAKLNLNDTALAPLEPFGSGSEVISRSFGSASQVLGAVVLEVDLDAARQKLRERWLAVGVAAAAVGTVLLLGAARVTRWVLRPVNRLNSAVKELAETGRAGQLPEDGPPELRELSRSFTAMAGTVSGSIESQRQLIADTSHELRNPIAALRLRMDILQLELRTARELDAAASVQAELARVEEILDGVLKLAAAEHRAFEDSARSFHASEDRGGHHLIDPFPILQEEVERAGPAADGAGSRLILAERPGTPAFVACNPAELAQMAGELLRNAIKYAPAATVLAAVRVFPDTISVDISDDGPGLSAEECAASTTRFWRANRQPGISGTGLGLTIVDKLAGANGARLLLKQAAAHGLVASIEFPAPPDGTGKERYRD